MSALRIDALEARDEDDLALVEGLEDPLGRDIADSRLGVKAVGDDADLAAGETDGWNAERLDGHGHEGHAGLLSGGEQHVQLTRRRPVADLTRHGDQLIGGVATRRDHHDDLRPLVVRIDGATGRRENPFRIGDAGAAELLDQEGHVTDSVDPLD